MPRGVYQRGPSTARPHVIRTLRPDEPRPDTEPRRYPDRDGYIRLRWKIGVRQYVEAREHRVAVGAAPGEHVHHKNRRRDDNRPDNLQPLNPQQHAAHHGLLSRKFDRARAAAMYRDGMSTPEIGALLGVNHVTVYRGLRRTGVALRSLSESARLLKLRRSRAA